MGRIAVFDIDGTILDSCPSWRNAVTEYAQEMGIEVEGGFPRLFDEKDFRGCLNYLSSFPQCGGSPRIVEDIFSRVREGYVSSFSYMPGALSYLEKLKSEQVPMYILTANNRGFIAPLSVRLHFGEIFDDIFLTEELGITKHDSSAFLFLLERLVAKPEDIVLFEDRDFSLSSASALGIHTVGVAEKGSFAHRERLEKVASRVITDFKELMEVPFQTL